MASELSLDKKILVTGHNGLVGSAIVRLLRSEGYERIITVPRSVADLSEPAAAKWVFSSYLPDYVFHCAAWVGGIGAHTSHSTQAILANSAIQNNVISCAAEYAVEKLLFLSSACAYPKHAEIPIREEYMMTGPLEPSNAGYALCKILGHELCKAYRKEKGCNFICAVPTNLYGLNDNYDPMNSHVLPGMIRKIHCARTLRGAAVTLWGTGTPIREFLWAGDLARAAMVLMQYYDSPDLINVGTSDGIDLGTLAGLIAEVIGFRGQIIWDSTKPDGTPVRVLNNAKMFNLGWKPQVQLKAGIAEAYQDFLTNE